MRKKKAGASTSIRMPSDLSRKVVQIAKTEHRSVGAQIRFFIELGIEARAREQERREHIDVDHAIDQAGIDCVEEGRRAVGAKR